MNFQSPIGHPSNTIIGTLGNELENKTIIHCVTSSISCFLAPMISRELMRHGAEVITVLSPEAAKMVHPMIFEWATGKPPIISIEGQVEHVQFAGLSASRADLILVAPITANSISKIANGIMDTAVTLITGTALGNKIPVVIVPTMHEIMMYNPAVVSNIEKLKEMGVTVLMPRIEEEKAKIPEKEEIVNHCIRLLYKNSLTERKILVTAGPTRAYMDRIRFISNPSSGKMGYTIALEAWWRNGKVTLVTGPGSASVPKDLEDIKYVEQPQEMFDAVVEELIKEQHDIVILAAAMNDFAPSKIVDEKRKSDDTWTLTLQPVRKLADEIKQVSPETLLVLFKAEFQKTDEELVEIALKRMKNANADLIVANDVAKKDFGFSSDYNRVAIIRDKDDITWIEGKKIDVAKAIWNKIEKISMSKN
ncbi:MAG: bifunctional phosphopantothenoylcysteine decarboxylase/phosphopantothenate--cysteine ligase CoaBC [Candidatus Heimdallarchaeaceae archaeon]